MPQGRIELPASPLPRVRSTTELLRRRDTLARSCHRPDCRATTSFSVAGLTGCRTLHERPPGLSNAAMGNDSAKGKGAQHQQRRQRLAEALRRNLKRRKVQDRSRAGDRPGDKPGATPDKNPGADGN